ncbi:MAG: UDP-N-acetylmuramoyl-tripeptide--D-alanyl-D-alanine ligase, partial [Chloroflexaceae bacterium]|nr:UDP-N-acetylmuramoyl-tripeptide--D-alanyl-D-alanine ligase [Chloroflexaceae bacterium]
MLYLDEIFLGVQSVASRQQPQLPAAWRKVAASEAIIDSREVVPDALFVALTGEQTDGHNFLAEVLRRGARGALVTREAVEQRRAALDATGRPWVLAHPANGQELAEQSPDTCVMIAVDDPLMALQRLAVHHRRTFTPTVVGITGSVGKTSTKEVTAAVLSRRFRTLKSKRSYNSEASLPTVLLQLDATHEVAVLEMGMWAPGEIRFLCNLARPNIGIVTNVGPSHLERMGSMEAIEMAKSELPESLPPDGVAILNLDDERVARMRNRTAARVFGYGLSPSAELWADQVVSRGFAGISFRAHYNGVSVEISTSLIGRHSVYTAMCGIAAGLVLEMSWDEIIAGLQESMPQSRLATLPGINGSTIIDDSYNAAPLSTLAALHVLADSSGRRIAVLGDMLELGSAEEEGHRQV